MDDETFEDEVYISHQIRLYSPEDPCTVFLTMEEVDYIPRFEWVARQPEGEEFYCPERLKWCWPTTLFPGITWLFDPRPGRHGFELRILECCGPPSREGMSAEDVVALLYTTDAIERRYQYSQWRQEQALLQDTTPPEAVD